MTLRQLVEVTPEELEFAAFKRGVDIERDPSTDRMYARMHRVVGVLGHDGECGSEDSKSEARAEIKHAKKRIEAEV